MFSYLVHIENAHLYASMGDSRAKKEVIEAVKTLNRLSKQKEYSSKIQQLSIYTLDLNTRIEKGLPFSEKAKWLNSKVGSHMYYPVVDFGAGIDSTDAVFIADHFEDPDTEIRLTPVDVDFQRMDSEWTNDPNELSHLYQDVLENCSFVSSLLSMVDTQYNVFDLISPHYSSSQYKVKLHFNGAQRVVTIDNYLPVMRESPERNLFVKSTLNERLLWPAFIEKAFLKVMGNGYRFAGSNIAADTFMLTGYVPEAISIANFKLPDNFPDLWKLHQQRKLLIGIGTTNLTKSLAAELNLISEHDYSVCSYDNGTIVLKNPWVETKTTSRFLRMDALNYFASLYVNWDVHNRHHTCVRFPFLENYGSFYKYPQYTFCGPAWLLLEAHLPFNFQQTSLSVYDSQGDRLVAPTQYPCVNSMESKTRFLLVKINLPGTYTAVVQCSSQTSFTLNAYSTEKVSLRKASLLYPSRNELSDSFRVGGGHWSLPTYIDNPQYLIEATSDTQECLVAIYSPSQLVNIHLFHCEAAEKDIRLRNFDKAKLLFSEKYTQDCVYFRVPSLAKGFYKAVVSTYEPCEHPIPYTLLLNYNGTLQVNSIPYSLGLFTQSHSVPWAGQNRFKVRFSVNNHNVKVTFALKHYSGEKMGSAYDYRPAIRGSVFTAKGMPIQVNDMWNDCLFGVYVDVVLGAPGEYVLLVERLEKGEGVCGVEMGSSERLYI